MTTAFSVQNPYAVILSLSGEGLNEGKVYVGLPNQDPVTNPKAVYWDAALTIPATQPLAVIGGYISYLGSPAIPYVAGPYSITVKDAQSVQVFTKAAVGLTSSTVPTQQKFITGSGTYTTPSGCTWLKVRMVGGGGGGGGTSVTGATIGGTGGNTTFGTTLLVANGGTGGGPGAATVGASGTGGAINLNGAVGFGVIGADGQGGAGLPSTATTPAPSGGVSFFGGGGAGSVSAGGAAKANTGSGGAAGGNGSSGTAANQGGGGGAGGYIEAIIPNPSATYAYAVGAAGTAGTGAVNNGGAGAAGVIIVEEHYD